MRWSLVVLVALSLAAGGCGSESKRVADQAVPSTTSTTAPPASITLAPDGFVVGSRHYTYDGRVTAAALEEAFRPRLGPPQERTDEHCDAGPLHVVTWPEVTAYFSEGSLAGWDLGRQPASPPLATAAGIGRGSTRREVERAYPGVRVDETSLGTEWFAAGPAPGTGLSGIFESSGPDAVNDALWSGRTCVAR